MFSNLTIAILFGLGSGAWIFARMQRHTGSNTKSSIIVSLVSGIIIIIFILLVLQAIFKK